MSITKAYEDQVAAVSAVMMEPDALPSSSVAINQAYQNSGRSVPLTWDGVVPSSRGDWMQTATGRAFYPLDPQPEEISIDDIAAALSKMCRYGGHTTRFYSVAEHCVHIASHPDCPDELRLTALLHDASEAYLSDVIRPIKPFLTNYTEIEQRLERVIAEKFGTIYPFPAIIKEMDTRILMDERDQAMAKPPQDWRLRGEPLGVRLQFWTPQVAEWEFLGAFYNVIG